MKRMITVLMLAAILSPLAAAAADTTATPSPDKRMKPALLVIDVQNAYLPWMSDADKGPAIPAINEYIGLFREQGFPVIFIYHTDPERGWPKPGTEPFEFPSSIQIKPGEPKVVKNYPGAFKKTDLEKILREKGVNTVFICGLSAVGCALATHFGATDLGFQSFMLKGALISHRNDLTRDVEEITEALGGEAVYVMLQNAQK